MDRLTISAHEIRILDVLRKNKGVWLTSQEVSAQAKVSDRTARMHLLRFVKMNIIERTQTFPGYRYRWKHAAEQTNGEYLRRIAAAQEAMSP
jgi:hypothetical protein